jgi:asparagine synthase (glutamine-hydrolysing)
MCGILGWWKSSGTRVEAKSILRLTDKIAHRGPDDEGYIFINRTTKRISQFHGPISPGEIKLAMPDIKEAESRNQENDPDLALSHRRFSIIDPKPEGHQPFSDSRQRVWLTFNGEIYNYIEVKEELVKLGHNFRTDSDTEVLVEAYLEWGENCFEKLNGMWAIALYDVEKRNLILCRDRTGERPLYWIRRNNSIVFASEIKALLDDEVYPSRNVNSEAVFNFLYQAGSDLDKNTFFEGVESVPAATVVRIADNGEISTNRYWRLPEGRANSVPEKEIPGITEELRQLLRSSVELRLRADVPVNVALSGGMDSSSVVAMAAMIRGKEGLDTYSVRFEEEDWNEYPFANAVAERYQVKNFVIDPTDDWTWDYLPAFVRTMEEPFHAPDLVPDHIVRHKLAERGIRVNLSGIGGDELFAGYEYHRRFHILDLSRAGNKLDAIKTMVFASDTTPFKRARLFAQYKLQSLYKRFQTKTEDPPDLRDQAVIINGEMKLRALPESCDDRLRSDIEWSLLPYWLRAGDKSSMGVPIEVRYPFLDHRLIEFAMQLPISLLIREGWSKWILREAMKDLLPDEVVWRKKKMGFPFPIVQWLTKAQPRLEVLFKEMENPFLSTKFWVNNLGALIKSDPWFVWRSLTLEMWHRCYLRGLDPLPRFESKAVVGGEIAA